MAVYYASKAYVLSFSEALHRELAGLGVRVTALCPGPVATGFQARPGMQHDNLRVLALSASGWRDRLCGFMRGERVVVAGIHNRIVASLLRFVPHGLLLSLISARAPPAAAKLHCAGSSGEGVAFNGPRCVDLCRIRSSSSCTRSTRRPAGWAMPCNNLDTTLDVRRPRFGEALPPTMAEHAGAVIFGGPNERQ